MHDKMPLFTLAHTINKQADQLHHHLGLLADRLIGPGPCAKGLNCPPQPSPPCLAAILDEAGQRLAACHDLVAVIEEAAGGQVEAMHCDVLGPKHMGGPCPSPGGKEMGGDGWPTGESDVKGHARPYVVRERR